MTTHFTEHLNLAPLPGQQDHQIYNGTHSSHTHISREEEEEGKKPQWTELEIRGPIKNLSPELWKLTYLTALFLKDNNLQVYTGGREGGREKGRSEEGRSEEGRSEGGRKKGVRGEGGRKEWMEEGRGEVRK